MNITQFTMEEVRCFAGRQEFNIRPLTFLVGENSTGKTTALACFQVLANYLSDGGIDFNSDPYSMGTFKDIVRNSTKKEKTFKLEFTYSDGDEKGQWVVEFVKKKGGIEPTVESAMLILADGEIVLNADDTEKAVALAAWSQAEHWYSIDVPPDILERSPPYYLLERLMGLDESDAEYALSNYLQEKHECLGYSWGWIRGNTVFGTSPVRSRPKRTYDPTREFDDPEGSDIPIRLMRTRATDKEKWETLRKQLIDFGRCSGLFQNIDVRNFGGSMGNPFQLMVKVRGPSSNIIDVGYGVSQILPILVHILDPPISRQPFQPLIKTAFFLLQQPEVHLHPRAQAEFSSLLATLASQGGRSFIVETHSDYMIDRARIEIRKGNIRPEDVSLIYLEPKRNVVNVHNIRFDKMGNMEGVPQHYREFFLKETKRLIGFED